MISLLLVDYRPPINTGVQWLAASGLPGCKLVGHAFGEPDGLTSIRQLLPDVVVINVGPDIQAALETARCARTESPSTKVVVVAREATARQYVLALEAGVHAVVIADAEPPDLDAAIRAVDAGATYLSQQATSTLVDEFFRRTGGRSGNARFDRLSAREKEVLKRIADGQRTAGIAEALSVSPKTVDTYRRRAMAKLDVTTVPALVKLAVAHGVTSQ